MLKKLFRSDPTPHIWWYTAWTRTKARFIRTYLGSFWIGLSNLFAVCALGSVYKYVFNVPNFKYYFGYLGIGITLWGFSYGQILASSKVFEDTRERSLNSEFTPSFFFLEEITFQFYILIQALIPILIVLVSIGTVNPLNIILSILPFLNFFLVIFFLSSLNSLISAKYKDISQLIPVLLQLIFLSSPILFYKENMGKASFIADYNIIYRALDTVRKALIDGDISFINELFFLPLILFLCFTSYKLMTKLRNKIILWY